MATTTTPEATTCRLYRHGILETADVDLEAISELLKEEHTLVWLDLKDPSEQMIQMLGEEFGFHELALEDSLGKHERPKIEQYEDYYFVVAYGVAAQGDELVEHEMAMFVGRNYLVTVRKEPPFDLDPVVKRWESHSDLAKEGGGYLLYILLDEIVDGYFDAIDHYEDLGEAVEEDVFGGGSEPAEQQVQEGIFQLKKELLKFRRAVSPLREVLDVMQRRSVEIVTVALEPYYRDVYDHVLRATDFVDNLRDLLSSALEAHLAVVSNRLNVVMKHLTSYAAIILVPTLVAGIYGMNFVHMPELRWRYGYAFALGLMAVLGFLLYRMFKLRDWL